MGLTYPEISPIMLQLGPLAIRWYSMAYLFGLLIGWWWVNRSVKKFDIPLSLQNIEDLVFYVTLGIILGGRLGYVLFYGLDMVKDNWLEIFAIWKGGMSFHGGVLGVVFAAWLFAKKNQRPFLSITDLIVLYAPIGIFCGRLANFVNDELWGRVTDVPWAVRFPNGGYLPRHPSQLYEAFFEGLVMFAVLNFLWRYKYVREHNGLVSALFITLYGIFRISMERFREPDAQLGFFFGHITMGQMLSVPLILVGASVIFYLLRAKKA